MNQTGTGLRRTVIMCCSGLGASVAVSLSRRGHTVHILDPRVESFQRLPTGEIESGNIVPIIGNGALRQDLLRASIQDADMFMALSGVDTLNALTGQMAKHLFQVPTVVCRIDDPTLQEMYEELGIVAISATSLFVRMIENTASL